MKKLVLIVTIAALPLAGTLAFHPDTDCSRCHIPHMAKDDASVPLWNPEVGLDPEGVTFTNYDSPSLDATVGDPTGSTLLCLGCHDGGEKHGISDVSGKLSGSHPIEFEYDAALVALDPELFDPTADGTSFVVNGKGNIAEDLLYGENNATMKCMSCHEIHVNGLHSVNFTLANGKTVQGDVPHLVNIPGIQYRVDISGNPFDIDDYVLSYSVLCRTCHYK